MRLHILNSPESLSRCQSLLVETDSLIFIEDAAVLACRQLSGVNADISLYALDDDLKRRGIIAASNVNAVTMEEFVDLCAEHSQCLSW
ncbi:sulfurtransferase complex subunit TusB [uncultured Zhongshania sp.]|uniref:sulfurtransferase complex subunit TusB n=1 Tax=uncultured Zhongshania sp. TaxID=1642288 RepID=UPI0025FE33BD|nr:sulfurtransferase complex subunit TusB [uncultured Zhongshania sp.]